MANHIPRNFNHILAELTTSGMAGKAGDVFEIVKSENGGYTGTSLATEKEWHIFPSHLRMEHLWKIIEIV